MFSTRPCSLAWCLLSCVYSETVFGFLGFHLEVVTLLIWSLINSAAFQSALTLTWLLHPSRRSTIATSSAAPAPLKAFHMKPADLLRPCGPLGSPASVLCSLAACVSSCLCCMSLGLHFSLSSDSCLISLRLRKRRAQRINRRTNWPDWKASAAPRGSNSRLPSWGSDGVFLDVRLHLRGLR